MTIGPGPADFIASLARPMPVGAADLIRQYRAQYAKWLLVPPAPPSMVRSRAFQDYASSVECLFQSPQLSGLLTSAPLSPVAQQFCSRESTTPGEVPGFISGSSFASTGIRAAAYLLTRTGAQSASYVGVVDSGLLDNLLPYDVHNVFQARRTSSNLWDTLSTLASLIKDPANPSPDDPNKLDLNTTMIVIKTEFGRTPYRSNSGVVSPTSNGRDHWPEGFVNVLIGGPISTVGVVGSILDGGGAGDQGKAEPGAPYDFFHRAEDVQSAVLLGAGLNAFDAGNFQLGEVSPKLQAGTHADSLIKIRQNILGVA
jgi:hypothetical protein